MSQISVWHCKFHIEATAGKITSDPYNAFIGISGGSRGDQQNSATVAALKSAIATNLLGILQGMGFAGSAVPGGTVVLDDLAH